MSEVADSEAGFVRQHRPAIIAGALAILALATSVYFLLGGDKTQVHQTQPFQLVKVLPPPPPPPPTQKLPEPKMIEQPKMSTQELKPPPHVDASKPNAPAKGPVGLDAKGEGPGDSFNLAGTPGGSGLLDGGGGSRWGWYATIVQQQVADALRANARTSHARFNIEVSIWADDKGHITRVHLDQSTGDADLDRIIQNEVLTGLTLREAPPSDMPMPIVMRNAAQRPG